SARVPADTGGDDAEGAVTFEDELGQGAGQVDAAVLHDPPVVGAAAGGVVAQDAADVAEVAVAAVAPAVVFDHVEAGLAQDIGQPYRVSGPAHGFLLGRGSKGPALDR